MFRLHQHTPPGPTVTPAAVRRLAAEALAPRHFYLAPGLGLSLEHAPEEELAWEVFHGRLLDHTQTRQRQTFEAWNLHLIDETGRSGEPLLSLKFDASAGQLHVVRGLLCRVWEGYDSGGGVILSRETTRWMRELVVTLDLNHWSDKVLLQDELMGALHVAVVGASRLPLTSVETPLPAFSLGRLFYCPRESSGPARGWRELLDATASQPLCHRECIKLTQLLLQITPPAELAELAPRLSGPVLPLLRAVINEASLSPWTNLVPQTLAFLDAARGASVIGETEAIDFLAGWLVQLGRHLTAYDLMTFHHRGANYPDALALDLILKRYLRHIEDRPEAFTGPEALRRRRGLRQGWLFRRFYEGHPVPEVPTSPGEAARVYPGMPVVPQEQILQVSRRPRRLYADDPLGAGPQAQLALAQALEDLDQPDELRELGLALFLDRPLGTGKWPGEPDQTVLLSHLAFSHSLARQRLRYLHQPLGLLSAERHAALQERLAALVVEGVPLTEIGGAQRPGSVSALDARQVADDFVFLRTTRGTLRDLLGQYDFGALPVVNLSAPLLLLPARDSPATLRLYLEGQALLDLRLLGEQGTVRQGGVEYLAGGLESGSIRLSPRLQGKRSG